jgi:hypothetical protein
MDEEAGVQAGATGVSFFFVMVKMTTTLFTLFICLIQEPTPSGDTVRHPASKSKAMATKKKSPKKKKKSDRVQSTSKAPAPSDSGEDDSEDKSPKKNGSAKKKRKRQSRLDVGLTPEELALDDPTDEDSSDSPAPSPKKGKHRASNSKNINPKSHTRPSAVPNSFLAYEEYAMKRDAGSHLTFHLITSW